ncbi:MAG: hypothetical protein J7K87_03945 [Candidatus Aenigmarchaeota archaeon]|nr:hypothetical protein [Candidatus Aenigmarchaeota archaeon]
MKEIDEFREARILFENTLQNKLFKEGKDDVWNKVFPIIDRIRELQNQIEIILLEEK